MLEDVLAHVAVWEPHIKALYLFDPEGARAAAKASTERWQKGEPTGALDGVPVTIKDNIATKGGRCRWARPASSWCRAERMRRRPRGCAKRAR